MVTRLRNRRRAGGMTLVEVMVALLLSTIGLLGLLALLLTMGTGSAFGRASTEASQLVQDKIEELNVLGNVTVSPVNPPNGTTYEYNLSPLGVPVAGGVYTRATTWALTTDSQRRVATVTVTWSDGAGRPHAISAFVERIP